MAYTVTLPHSNAALDSAGNRPSREYFRLFGDLVRINASNSELPARVDALDVRVTALEDPPEDETGRVTGLHSVQTHGLLSNGIVTIELVNDAGAPANTSYYGTSAAGSKGWHLVADAIAVTPDLTRDVGADGVTTLGLADLTNTGTGAALVKITRDSKGRISGTSAATTTDLAEGANLYWTNARGDARIAAQKGLANGLAPLGDDAKINVSYLPAAVLGQVSYQGTWDASAGTPPTSTPSKGWYYIVTVAGGTSLSGITDWKVGDWAIYNGASWDKVDNTDAIASWNGRTGAVVPQSGDYTPAQVGAEPAIAAGTTAQYRRGDKTWQTLNKAAVGLGNVDNTSDANKPVSTPQATALAAKRDKSDGTFAVDVSATNLQPNLLVTDWNIYATNQGAFFPSCTSGSANGPGPNFYSGIRVFRLSNGSGGEVVVRETAGSTELYFRGWSGGTPSAWKRSASFDDLAGRASLGSNTFTGMQVIDLASGDPTLALRSGGVTRGTVRANSSGSLVISGTNDGSGSLASFYLRPKGDTVNAGQVRLFFDGTLECDGPFRPVTDNLYGLGQSSNRWSVVYAATGAINTSDAREKTTVDPLTDAELAAAGDLARAIGTYQWLSAVEAKGDAARHHAGLTVQQAIAIMVEHGLDPMRYGFICYDQWDELPEIVTSWPAQDAVLDDDGNVITPAVEAGSEVTQEYRPAGDRYSFRHDELLLFLARGFDARLTALESA